MSANPEKEVGILQIYTPETTDGKILIVVGSKSDAKKLVPLCNFLQAAKIAYVLVFSSAHRTPELTAELAEIAIDGGFEVIIAAGGMALALPGCLAAHTTLPVIALPLSTDDGLVVNELAALLTNAQMPPDVPILVIGVNGAKNAAIAASQILGIKYPRIAEILKNEKEKAAQKTFSSNALEVIELIKTFRKTETETKLVECDH